MPSSRAFLFLAELEVLSLLIRQTVLPVTLPVTFPPRASIFSFKALRFSKWFRLPVITKDCRKAAGLLLKRFPAPASLPLIKAPAQFYFFPGQKIHKRTCDDWSYAIHRRQLFCRCSEHFVQIIFIFPTNHPRIGNSNIRDSKACKSGVQDLYVSLFQRSLRDSDTIFRRSRPSA